MSAQIRKPKVSIGLPVYNGEKLLGPTIDSILGQDYKDFELIICDNASSDKTQDICRDYASRDDRIRYYRNPENIGVGPNFNLTFKHAKGEYFKWAAHDDLHEGAFLSQCVNVLESNPDVILAYTRAITINSSEERIREWGASSMLLSELRYLRLRACLEPLEDPLPLPLFGIMRSDILRQTRLMGGHPSCDLVLLAELALSGKFHEIHEPLFIQRNHEGRLGPAIAIDLEYATKVWDPNQKIKFSMYQWKLFSAYMSAINTIPLEWKDRLRCYGEMPAWMISNKKQLAMDFVSMATMIPLIGPTGKRLFTWYGRRKWDRKRRDTVKDISTFVPVNAPYILADQGCFANAELVSKAIPFIGRDGKYWGNPKDDNEAITELERQLDKGVKVFVIAWPCFWWFDYYLA